jgi:RsiW-degrading membrane proteinase PrsW (M82 family)
MEQSGVINPNFESRSSNPAIHWPSVWQLTLSLMGTLGLWGIALILGMTAMSSALSTPGFRLPADSLPILLMAAGVTLGGILLLPSAGYALLRLLNRPAPFEIKLPHSGLLVILIPLFVVLGFLVTRSPALIWIALPPIHVITIGISILWLLSLGIRGLSAGSKQQAWGIFNAGMVAAPLFSLLVEFLVLIAIGLLTISYLARDPVFAQELTQISESFTANPNQSPDAIYALLEPYLLQPIFVYVGLVIVAILVPLIEELFKPIGVWLLIRQRSTPAQGFAAGVLSGAGFALFENITLAASSGEEWSLLVLVRLGTSMIHMLTAGLTGWALVLAWEQKHYIRLGVTYLTSVAIHALWNGLAVLAVAPEILPSGTTYPESLRNIGTTSPLGFVVLLIGGFVLLLACNTALRHAIIPPVNSRSPKNHPPGPAEELPSISTTVEVTSETSASLTEKPIEEYPNHGNNQHSD